MKENKLTPEEIKKALECCSKPYCNDNKCPLHKNTVNTKDCITQLSTNALALINHQQAQIDKMLEDLQFRTNQVIEQQAEIERLQKNG